MPENKLIFLIDIMEKYVSPNRCCLLVVALLLFVGCDLGTYSKRYDERMDKSSSIRNTNKDLSQKIYKIGNAGSIRLPKIFTLESSEEYGPEDDFKLARVNGMDFPGFVKSYIGDKKSGENWLPVQGYFFVIAGGDKSSTDIQGEISEIIKQRVAERAAWENTPILGNDGETRAWSKMTVTGTQPFFVFEPGSDNQKEKNLTGRMDLYLRSSDQSHFLVVMRSPAEVFDDAMVLGMVKSYMDP